MNSVTLEELLGAANHALTEADAQAQAAKERAESQRKAQQAALLAQITEQLQAVIPQALWDHMHIELQSANACVTISAPDCVPIDFLWAIKRQSFTYPEPFCVRSIEEQWSGPPSIASRHSCCYSTAYLMLALGMAQRTWQKYQKKLAEWQAQTEAQVETDAKDAIDPETVRQLLRPDPPADVTLAGTVQTLGERLETLIREIVASACGC